MEARRRRAHSSGSPRCLIRDPGHLVRKRLPIHFEPAIVFFGRVFFLSATNHSWCFVWGDRGVGDLARFTLAFRPQDDLCVDAATHSGCLSLSLRDDSEGTRKWVISLVRDLSLLHKHCLPIGTSRHKTAPKACPLRMPLYLSIHVDARRPMTIPIPIPYLVYDCSPSTPLVRGDLHSSERRTIRTSTRTSQRHSGRGLRDGVDRVAALVYANSTLIYLAQHPLRPRELFAAHSALYMQHLVLLLQFEYLMRRHTSTMPSM